MHRLPSRRIVQAACAAALGAASFAWTLPAGACPGSVTSDQFAPDWQSQSHAMFNRGPVRDARTNWYAPANLPRGHYVVINREGDKAKLIDGYSFDVTSNASRDIHVVLPMGYGYVEALPASYVPAYQQMPPQTRFDGP